MQAEWVGNLPEVTFFCAQNEVIGRGAENAVEAETHKIRAVAKPRNVCRLRFIGIPFRNRAAIRSTKRKMADTQWCSASSFSTSAIRRVMRSQIETGVSQQLEIMPVIDLRVRKTGFILAEKTEFAVGESILRVAVNRGKEGFFRLCLIFFQRRRAPRRFKQCLLFLLLGHLQNLIALPALAVGSKLVSSGFVRFRSERAIGIAQQYLILRVTGELLHKPGCACHSVARGGGSRCRHRY